MFEIEKFCFTYKYFPTRVDSALRILEVICSLLLSLAGSSFAAAAEELPNYATQPAVDK